MDKVEWAICLKSLKKVRAKKKELLEMTTKHLTRDLEELDFTISCYEKQIQSLNEKLK